MKATLTLLVLAVVLAGCSKGADPDPEAPPVTGDPGYPGMGPGTGGPGNGGDGGGDGGDGGDAGTGGTGGTGNVTGSVYADDPWAGEDEPEWPALSDVSVRPGVQIQALNNQCTTNFLFRDVYTGALYLGTAAHCVQGTRLDQDVQIRDIDDQIAMMGTVAYSSWWSIGFEPQSNGLGGDIHPHDFALIRIPDDQRQFVHPAVLHFGGPTGIAEWGLVSALDLVLAYGNSGMRPAVGLELGAQEGYVVSKRLEENTYGPGYGVLVHAFLPPLPGDSGSPVMTKAGAALGGLSAIYVGTPYGAWWEYSSIPHALLHLEEEGWNLRIGVWELIDDGMLP